MWIDTHAHLSSPQFAEDVDAVVQRAHEAGVDRIVCVADNLATARGAINLAQRHVGIYATAGFHPHQAGEVTADDLAELRRLLASERVVAVGEIGLDFHYDFSPAHVQERVFREQLLIALELNLPIILHSRKAEQRVLEILSECGVPAAGGVMHCFWGDAATAQRALELGLSIGVGGPITFKNTNDLRDTIKHLPLERLIVETDAPYLAPVPKRGRRNEPAYVPYVGAALAGLFQLPVDQVAKITSEHAERLFRLDG